VIANIDVASLVAGEQRRHIDVVGGVAA